MFSLKKNFAWMMSGQVIFSGLQFSILVLLAQWANVEAVGAYSLALAITTPLVAFSALGLRTVFTTDFQDQFSDQHYLWLRGWGSAIAFVFLIIVALFYSGHALAFWCIVIVGIGKICENISDIYYAFAHKEERMDKIAKSMMIRAVISTAVFALCLWFGVSVVMSFLAYTLVWLGVLLIYDVKAFSVVAWGKIMPLKELKGLFMYALPLGLATTIYMVAQNVVRYVVEYEMGLEALGAFSAVAYSIVIGQIVVNTVGQTLRPRMAKVLSRNDTSDFWRMARVGLMISFLMGLGLVVVSWGFGEFILGILYGVEYKPFAHLFFLMSLSSIPVFCGTFLGFTLSAVGAYKMTLLLSVFGVFVGLVSALVLVPFYGLNGAAYSVGLLGLAFCCALPFVYVQVSLKKN